jgi:hypothetical protein
MDLTLGPLTSIFLSSLKYPVVTHFLLMISMTTVRMVSSSGEYVDMYRYLGNNTVSC